MTAITLTRSDAARNMRRFYRMDVQPDLFGEWCFVREWGRIGRAGRPGKIPDETRAGGERIGIAHPVLRSSSSVTGQMAGTGSGG